MARAYRPMLAIEFEKFESHIRFPLIGQPKLDGIRCVCINGQPLSRSGKLIPNKFIQDFFWCNRRDLEYFDGELLVGPPNAPDVYNRTQSGVMSHDGNPDFTYVVFDVYDPGDQYTTESRVNMISMLIHERLDPRIVRIESTIIPDSQSLESFEERMIEQGYEGVILRDPQSSYKQGRSTPRQGCLVKMKRFTDSEATIVGFEELMHNQNEARVNEIGLTSRSSHQANKVPGGTLGKFICECYFNGQLTTIRVGSGRGLDRALRQKIWDNQEAYMHKIIKFKYLAYGSKNAPRQGIFLGFRDPSDM